MKSQAGAGQRKTKPDEKINHHRVAFREYPNGKQGAKNEERPLKCVRQICRSFLGKRIAEPEKFAPDAGCLERHRKRFVG